VAGALAVLEVVDQPPDQTVADVLRQVRRMIEVGSA
jgi:hypothetical protein